MSLLNRLNKKLETFVSVKGEVLKIGRTRLRIIQTISLIIFALIVIRLGDLMLLQKPQEPFNDSGISLSKIINRSDIVDRNGILLATTLQVASLYSDPTLIDNKAYIAKRLEDVLGIDSVLEKLNRKGKFVWIKRGITPDEHYAINELGSPGLAFKTEERRFYPQGHLLSHLVGYTSIDGVGLSGMELEYNDQLKKGLSSLQLNVDVRVQHSLVKSLSSQMNKFNAKSAIGGVIDVQTGEVIAAVSLPDFDPHHVGKTSDNNKFNRFAHAVYEMGSTFKLFSTANFIEKTGKPFSTVFDARKSLKEGRFTISDYHAEKRILTLPEVFIHSSNIGSALMGREIGAKAMQEFYTDLGLMNKVDADYPALAKPLIPKPWREINTLTASYGHGIAVSPLHVLQAAATIANNGITSHLSFAKNGNKNKIENRILSASTSYKMKQLLRLNVTDGSGKNADVVGYNVGGKTGTSDKATANGYDKNRRLSSFIGMFPIENPLYVVLAILDEPKGNKKSFGYATGGWVAAPVVKNVIADMAHVLGIPPTKNNSNITLGLSRYLHEKKSNYKPAKY